MTILLRLQEYFFINFCRRINVNECDCSRQQRQQVIPSESIQRVNNNQDLILQTKLNRLGKKIVFIPGNNYKGFQGEISILFPPYSVLEEEDIYLEIIPEDIITYYNEKVEKKIKSEKVITPVLHVERDNGAPFLSNVVVTLPLISNVSQELLSLRIKTSNDKIALGSSFKQIRIRTTKFSEAGVKYDELSKCLDALAMNDDFSLKYTDLGVYFMVEQLPQSKFMFDLRKFRNWQEHRRFRMDPTKFYCLLLNPQRVQETDYQQSIQVSIPGWPNRSSFCELNFLQKSERTKSLGSGVLEVGW